jgi:hypothetical protein
MGRKEGTGAKSTTMGTSGARERRRAASAAPAAQDGTRDAAGRGKMQCCPGCAGQTYSIV